LLSEAIFMQQIDYIVGVILIKFLPIVFELPHIFQSEIRIAVSQGLGAVGGAVRATDSGETAIFMCNRH
jgi:small basic protein